MSKKPKREPTVLEEALSSLRDWVLIADGRAKHDTFDQETFEQLAQAWKLVQQSYAVQCKVQEQARQEQERLAAERARIEQEQAQRIETLRRAIEKGGLA